MRAALLTLLLPALALAVQYPLLVGPNATIPVSFNGSTLVVNGTAYRVPNAAYNVLLYPVSGKYYSAIIGVSYPTSACSLTTGPDGFSITCVTNEPMVVAYVASPGYSLSCYQQPQSRQSQGLVNIMQFNSLRLDCKVVSGIVGAALSPSLGIITAALSALTVALSITIAGLFLLEVLKRTREAGSSR